MTGYENYSKIQLHTLFSTNNWNALNFNQRINACQEVENRYATENGVSPCQVRHENMNGSTYGYQSGNTIVLNTSLLRDGTFVTEYKDANGNTQIAQVKALAPSWNTLDTIYHEGTHGIQEASGRMPYTYISPSMDHDLYRIQGIEKEAYAMGQMKTLDAISEVEQYTGIQDASKHEYIEYVKMDSFNAALQDSMIHYNDINIEQTVNDVIYDRDNGVVRTNCSASYTAVNNLCNQQYYHSNTAFQDKEVTSTVTIEATASEIRNQNASVEFEKNDFSPQTLEGNYSIDAPSTQGFDSKTYDGSSSLESNSVNIGNSNTYDGSSSLESSSASHGVSNTYDGSSSLETSSANIETANTFDGMGESNFQSSNENLNSISSNNDYGI